MADTEQIEEFYFIDDRGRQQKCHKLFPEVIKMFNNGEIPMDVTKGPVVDVYHERTPENGVLNETWNDRKNQTRATEIFAEKMNCKVHTYPQLWPVDGYAYREKRVLGMLEIKGAGKVRNIGYLNFRKYINLRDATRVSNNSIPGYFAIYDAEGLHWIDIKELGTTVQVEMAMVGYTILKSQADIEPAFRIKKSDMHLIKI